MYDPRLPKRYIMSEAWAKVVHESREELNLPDEFDGY
jgi:hypothetical protein